MKTTTAIALAGSRAALAAMLDISLQATYAWGADVPPTREWQMRALRPDWFAGAEGDEVQAARMDRILKLTDELSKEVKQWRTACGGRRRARR